MRVFMVNNGRGVLYGELGDIKSRYRRNSIFLDYDGELDELNGASIKKEHYGAIEIIPDKNTSPEDILEQLLKQRIKINRFEVSSPPLHDIFLQVVGEDNA